MYNYGLKNNFNKTLLFIIKKVTPPILRLDEIDLQNKNKVESNIMEPNVDTMIFFCNSYDT
jgi:hypothetical protein